MEYLNAQPQGVIDLTLLKSKMPLHIKGIKTYMSDIALAVCIEYEEHLLSIDEKDLPGLFRLGHCTHQGIPVVLLNMPQPLTGLIQMKAPYIVYTSDDNVLTFKITPRSFETARGSNKRSGALFKGRISLPLYDPSSKQQILTAFENAALNCGLGNIRIFEGTDKLASTNSSTSMYFAFEPVEKSTHPSMADVEWSPTHCQALTHIRLPSSNFMQATFSNDLLEEYHLCWCCLKDTRRCTGPSSVTDAIRKRKATATIDRNQMKREAKQRMRSRLYLESTPAPIPRRQSPSCQTPHQTKSFTSQPRGEGSCSGVKQGQNEGEVSPP